MPQIMEVAEIGIYFFFKLEFEIKKLSVDDQQMEQFVALVDFLTIPERDTTLKRKRNTSIILLFHIPKKV